MYTDDEKDRIIKEKNPLVRPRTGTNLCNALDEFAKEVVIIIQTVNENEFWAAVNHMGPPVSDDGNPLHSDGNGKPLKTCVIFPHPASHVGMFGGYKAALVRTGMGEKCWKGIECALGDFPNAKAIIGVGVAYGNDRKKCKLGDVLVSKSIVDMSSVKFEQDGSVTPRGSNISMKEDLQTIFCRETKSFAMKFTCTTQGSKPKIIPGTILSRSDLINNENIKKKFFEKYPEAVGGEMEGYVLLKIREKLADQKPPRQLGVIIIKGVCDYADGTKDKTWQFTAAMAAVAYAHYQLERGEHDL